MQDPVLQKKKNTRVTVEAENDVEDHLPEASEAETGTEDLPEDIEAETEAAVEVTAADLPMETVAEVITAAGTGAAVEAAEVSTVEAAVGVEEEIPVTATTEAINF